MIVTFTPAEGEQRSWIFDPDTFPQPDSERVEELTGLLWEQAKEAIIKGGARARRALVYCYERRTHPSLSWATFTDFGAGAIKIEFTRDELEKMSAALDTAPGVTEADKAEARIAIASLLEDAPETPKAPEPHGVPAM